MTSGTEMATHRCRRCRNFWTSNSHAAAAVITNFCPNCIPVISRRLAHGAPHLSTVALGGVA